MKRVFSTAACSCGSSTCWFRQVFDTSKLKSYRSRLLFWKGITMKIVRLTSQGRAGNGSVKVNLHGTCCTHFTLASGPSVVFFSESGLLSKTRHYKPWQQKNQLVDYMSCGLYLYMNIYCFARLMLSENGLQQRWNTAFIQIWYVIKWMNLNECFLIIWRLIV